MAKDFLYDYQKDAVSKMKNGCILNGGVGTGKSRTSLYYYFQLNGGRIEGNRYTKMSRPMDLYIITTARKRDTREWEDELKPFKMENYIHLNIVIDSWNNIKKYVGVQNAFFIFDEQRVVGNGTWVKSFLAITKSNKWILLSATPGDTWTDYIPVFIANGFYRNRTDFINQHVIYSRFSKYPKIDRYVNTRRLVRLRDGILVDMSYLRKTVRHDIDIFCDYNKAEYKEVFKNRWDPFKQEPIQQASSMCYILRRLVNTYPDRQIQLLDIVREHPKSIIFYNFDYELDILKGIFEQIDWLEVAEWNGHKHQEIPESDKWVYLVQYTAGCEGWNCIQTDTIIFYSQNYSYKVLEQARGRIDRLNTPYVDLYYYHLKSRSGIDIAISRAIHSKKNLVEKKFVPDLKF